MADSGADRRTVRRRTKSYGAKRLTVDGESGAVLRGFERLSIDKGGKAVFTADLMRRDLSNWDTVKQNWVINSEPKTVFVGPSSRNLPLSQALP